MQKGFVYRLYPTKEQEILIKKTIGCSRFVYNHFLSIRQKAYQKSKIGLNYNATSGLLTAKKQELDWLKEVDKFALQNTLRDLQDAYNRFFKKQNKYPTFKKKHGKKQSYRTNFTNNNIQILGNKIKLPKLGLVDFVNSRTFKGEIISATVRQTSSGKFYVSVLAEVDESENLPETVNYAGIDLGLKCFAQLSNGNVIDNPKFLSNATKRIRRYQRRFSRKQKGSQNRNKARILVALAHEKVKHQRSDFLHKASTAIVKENQIIIVEDLAVKNMLKNHKLAKAISDVSWSEFKRMLEYKSIWYGRIYHEVDRFYPSSQLCSGCGYQNPKTKDLSVRYWVCPKCKSIHDRDENASKNILQQGLRELGIA